MNCFMFPGQHFFAEDTLPSDSEFLPVVELIRRHARYDLLRGCWLEAQGSQQVALQLSGMAQSLYLARRLVLQGALPAVVAEHGCGIYPALVACGCLSDRDAVELAFRIGSCLAGMRGRDCYAMGHVTGLPVETVQGVADNNQVYLAHHNTPRDFTISGRAVVVEAALNEALDCGAFSARTFACDAPLHSPLLGCLEGALGGIVSDYRYAEPSFPLMNHLNQDFLRAADIPHFLLKQLQLPVYWERTYRSLKKSGVCRFLEVGAGDLLRQFNRWMDDAWRLSPPAV
jgi:[acyl-carrier-protein] S-malonyltransferase